MEPVRERHWLIPTALLCCYGFLKEIRPSEPFLTPYLRGDKNLTEQQVDNEVYPVWTYTYMVALIFVFVLTDLLRYKPVIVFEGLAYIATWSILLWAYGVTMMKLMQFMYAFATSTEVAYLAYIFAAVSSDHYQQVSSYTRSSLLAGRFVAAVIGQLLISFKVTTYRGLNYISLTFVSLGFVISLFLPSVHKSTYFHRDSPEIQNSPATDDTNQNPPQVPSALRNESCCTDDNAVLSKPPLRSIKERTLSCFSSTKRFSHYLWADFKSCYSNRRLLEWSLWWAFATCGNLQVGNYIQNLWDTIFTKSGDENSTENVYNGAVEALSTLLGALSAFLIMFPRVDWDRYGELLLGVVSIIDAILLFIMALTTNIWLCYSFYIIFRASYQLVITIAIFQIAKHLTLERYALVFGWNTFVALVLETILTLIVVDYRTLNLPADTQFLVYGGYFYLLGTAFCIKAVYQAGQQGCRQTLSCCHGNNGACLELHNRVPIQDEDEGGEGEGGGAEQNLEEEEQEKGAKEIDEVKGGDTVHLVM
ncbi:thiamine transporter 2 [Strongylocentrotus purpuratus]|uniref:Thiamine transporter 2 n=1 Tax=Strongylocentrotus purpuratus TaxID=7668 RepID=A0A7M7RG96_STRPU|nr:thiamine transporter 2 [Strongylocentrotus purpuratus]